MKLRFTIALAILLALSLPLVALADVTSYTSGFQVQNLDPANPAGITITFYKQDGSVETTIDDSIVASGSNTYYPLDGVSTGFNGSVVIASDRQVAAIANVLGNDGAYGASYNGFAGGAEVINVPLVMKNNYGISTWFNVQNTGSSNADVTVAYAPGTCTETATILPGASHTFNQGENTCFPAFFVGAANITSNGVPIAATVMQVTGSTSGLMPSLLAYNGFNTASVFPVMPLVTSGYYGSGTGIQIQNTGAVATNVTLAYNPSAGFPGAACTELKNIPAGQSVTFGFPNLPAACYTNAGRAGSAAFVGSAAVTVNSGSVDLVAVVNQVTTGTSTAAAYGAFDANSATANVSLPLIMDRNYGIFTGFSVANVGTAETTVNCTFSGTSYTKSATLSPGEALTDVQSGLIADRYVGSAVCTATGGDTKIAAVVNQLNPGTVIATEDGLLVYEGINY